jgi:flagellar biosynthesis/type III secretory pathway M-ring protein FliF/YscJ
MDFLKQQLDRIQQQLSGLNASQKMLAACMVAIIVITVAWWGNLAGTSEMAPLFEERIEAAEAARIKQFLKGHGITAEIGADNKVSVPAASLNEAWAQLALSEAMPKNPSINFDSFMKGLSPFASQTLGEAHLIQFKSARLAEVIREFPGVKGAEVFIDATQKFGLGGTGIEPSATVNIKARDAKAIPQSLVDGAANLVLGAQAGLSWKRVTVMVNGMPRRVSDPETRGMESPDLLELRERYQDMYAAKVEKLLMIPGLSVSVTFGINDQTLRRRSHVYDKKNSFNIEAETQEKTRESTGGAGVPAGEPGTVPNAPMAVGPGGTAVTGGAESNSNETDSKTKFEVFPSDVVEESVKTAGLGDPKAAAVMVPRSHVIEELKLANGGAEPTAQQVEAWFAKEEPDLRKMVMSAVGLASADAVSMALYRDRVPRQPAGGAGAPVQPGVLSTASLASMAGTHSREIVLGGLAVVSLFMVSMMVRRGTPPTVALAGAMVPQVPMPVLDASEQLAGEVSEGKSMLDAMELDEDAVRAQQMVDQVAAMVEDNPDAAASLVKRWMSRT